VETQQCNRFQNTVRITCQDRIKVDLCSEGRKIMQKTHAFKRRVIHFADEAFKPSVLKSKQ
jgi:hypothetical protein